MKSMSFETETEWEKWLEKNYASETELWLVYYKIHTRKLCISYDDSVRLALCYGWIDGLVKRIDEDSYARRFTPRKEKSVWSESNKKRVSELINEGKMKPAGMKLVQAAKMNGNWTNEISTPEIDLSVPEEFRIELAKNQEAENYFNRLNKRHRKEYLVWIKMAKRPETRERRIKQAVDLLLEKKKLGLK